MAVPKLRFKEFDADYTNTTFEKLKGFSIQSGKSEEKGDTGEFPFYGSTGVIGYKDIFDYEGKSILIARVGANAGSLYQIDGKYSVSDNTLRLTVSDDTSLDYLRELLIKFNLNRLVFGTGQPLVTGGMIKKVNIFIPEFTEQTKIASFLSNVDEKISQLTQKHELLNQYKQGMMQKLFSQEIRFKADDGSEFGEWEISKFDEVLSTISIRNNQIQASQILEEGDIPVIDQGQKYIAGYTQVISKILEPKSGLIIFGDHTTFLKYVDFSFVVGADGVKVLEVEKNSLSKYVYYYLCHNKLQPEGYKRHFTILREIEILVPCLAEQTKIANFLSAIDQKIEVVAQQIEQAKTWKKGLLQQMFI